jgi:hypothetical protein
MNRKIGFGRTTQLLLSIRKNEGLAALLTAIVELVHVRCAHR